MSMKYLGETFDIHGGGLENQFPHHECEIAQSECATGHPFVKYWMHNNMVTTGGVKMGKSLGNSAYLRDLYKEYTPLALRYTILQSHYRSTTEFTAEAIKAAETGYNKLFKTFHRLVAEAGKSASSLLDEEYINGFRAMFREAMDDDFNTPKAIAVLYELDRDTRNYLAAGLVPSRLDMFPTLLLLWKTFAGDLLGILPDEKRATANAAALLAEDAMLVSRAQFSSLVSYLDDERWKAKNGRDYTKSDEIREILKKAGVTVEDNKDGTGRLIY
jgi:cysteinyl-tRNA synthetase